MARKIQPFNISTEFTVDAGKGMAALGAISKAVTGLSGGFGKSVSLFSKGAGESIGKFQQLGGIIGNVTAQLPGFGSAMSGLNGPVGLALGSVAALGSGAVAASVGIFKMAEGFSAAGSKIHDAAQQMGVGAELASVLKYAAEQSGTAFESLAMPIGRFSKTVAEAARGSEEAAVKLKRFGVAPKEAIQDLEGALGKVFKRINDAPAGIARTTLAQDAFGKSGAALIPVILGMNGELAKFSETAREAGVVMSQADADAADKFGDTLGTLQTQLKFTSYVFASQFAPVIEEGMSKLSKTISDNKDTIKEWGTNFADVMRGAVEVSKSSTASMVADAAKWIALHTPAGLAGWYTAQFLKDKGKAAREAGDIVGGSDATMGRPRPGGEEEGIFSPSGKGKGAAAKDELAPFKAILDRVSASMKFFGQNTERARVEQQFMAADIDKLNPKLRAHAELIRDNALSIAARMDAEKQAADQAKENAAEQAEREQAYISATSDLLGQQAEIIRELTFGTKTASNVVDDYEEAQKRLGNTVDETDRKMLRARARMIDLINLGNLLRSSDSPLPGAGAMGEEGEKAAGVDGMKIIAEIGEAPAEIVDKWKPVFSQLKDLSNDALGSMAQAVGSMVQSWVLMGDTADMSMQKMVASVLAGVAAQSATLAVFELAQGFANLFFNPPAAAAHFLAAKIFGSIAIGAGLVGRATAGGSFKDQSSGAGGGGYSPGFGAGTFRARGGPVMRGRPYIVGENRAEVFVPGENGRIHPDAGAFGGGEMLALMQRLNSTLDRFDMMKPGDVVAAGADRIPDAMSRDANLTRRMGQRFSLP